MVCGLYEYDLWWKGQESYIICQRGTPAQHGCVGCVVVTKRKGGHHVGIVKGYDTKGNVITVSGNHGRKVGVGKYAKRSVVAYRYV